MERTYSPEQTAYLTAKARYDDALKLHRWALAQYHFDDLLQTADDDTLVDIEIKAQGFSHLDEAMDAYLKAEKTLFAWGQEQSRKARRFHSNKDEALLVTHMFTNIHTYPHLKEKLATICLALDLSK